MDNLKVSYNVPTKRLITTDDGRKYEKPTTGKTLAAVVAGNGVSTVIMGFCNSLASKPFNMANKNMSPNSPLLSKEIFEAVDKVYQKSGLAEKGVKIFDIKNAADIPDNALFEPWIRKNPFFKFRQKLDALKEAVADGKNAFFSFLDNSIYLNKEKMSFTSFHEMGHAINRNYSTVGKLLQHASRFSGLIVGAVAIIAIWKRPKAEGEKPNGTLDKTTTFIKNNAGKIVFASMLPKIFEEGLASYRGIKLAKEFLSADKLKHLKIYNAKALLTYVGFAASAILGTVIGREIRDYLAKPKEVKAN